jgi:hypothetical protein
MEVHTRVELINTLLEEAEQKIQALHHAQAAQERAHKEMPPASHGTPATEEETVKYEHALWEKARTGLTEVRAVLEAIEESERQRGVMAQDVGV